MQLERGRVDGQLGEDCETASFTTISMDDCRKPPWTIAGVWLFLNYLFWHDSNMIWEDDTHWSTELQDWGGRRVGFRIGENGASKNTGYSRCHHREYNRERGRLRT